MTPKSHVDALVARLLIAAISRDELDFAPAVDEVLTDYMLAADVIAALSVRAADTMLTLSEATVLTFGHRPADEARAELTERLEWRLLAALETVAEEEDR